MVTAVDADARPCPFALGDLVVHRDIGRPILVVRVYVSCGEWYYEGDDGATSRCSHATIDRDARLPPEQLADLAECADIDTRAAADFATAVARASGLPPGAIPGDPAELIDWDTAKASAKGCVDGRHYIRVGAFTVERRGSRITATRARTYRKQAGVLAVPGWSRTITDEIPPPTVEQFERMRREAPFIED